MQSWTGALSSDSGVLRGATSLPTSVFEPDSQQPAVAFDSNVVAISIAVQRKLPRSVSHVMQSDDSCWLSFRMPFDHLFQLRIPGQPIGFCERIAHSGQ